MMSFHRVSLTPAGEITPNASFLSFNVYFSEALNLVTLPSNADLQCKLCAPAGFLITAWFPRAGGYETGRGACTVGLGFNWIFIQGQSSVALLAKPLISFRHAWLIIHKSSFYVHPSNGAGMAPINNSRRRPGGQILYWSFDCAALIVVPLVLFELVKKNCWNFFFFHQHQDSIVKVLVTSFRG